LIKPFIRFINGEIRLRTLGERAEAPLKQSPRVGHVAGKNEYIVPIFGDGQIRNPPGVYVVVGVDI
jgi:hypothetical protein